MLELRIKKILDVSSRYDGDVVVTILAEKAQNAAVNKIAQVIGRELAGYVIKLFKPRKKRSLDANNYMWVLCDKIADTIKTTKQEVYKTAIKSVGVWEDIRLPKEGVERLVSGWEHNGTGWITEIVDKVSEAVTVRLYYGSSSYDSKEMSRLVDEVVTIAKDFNIETMTPGELERMKAAWGVKAT